MAPTQSAFSPLDILSHALSHAPGRSLATRSGIALPGGGLLQAGTRDAAQADGAAAQNLDRSNPAAANSSARRPEWSAVEATPSAMPAAKGSSPTQSLAQRCAGRRTRSRALENCFWPGRGKGLPRSAARIGGHNQGQVRTKTIPYAYSEPVRPSAGIGSRRVGGITRSTAPRDRGGSVQCRPRGAAPTHWRGRAASQPIARVR